MIPIDTMGKHIPGQPEANCSNAPTVQQVLAFPAVVHGGQTHYGNIHGSPVFWEGPDTGRVYVWGENSQLRAYRYSQGKLQDVSNPKETGVPSP